MSPKDARSQSLLRVAPGVVLGILVVLGGAFALWHHATDYSKLDGAYLAEFEHPTVAGVRDGAFMAAFDTYVDQRLPGRDTMLAAHAALVKDALRDAVVDDVFTEGPGGQLLDKPPALTVPASLAEDAAALADAADGTQLLWVYAPRKEEVFADALPAAWPNPYPTVHSEIVGALGESGDVLDLSDMMAAQRQQGTAFFPSDHHWSPTAALAAVDATAQRLAQDGVTIGAGPQSYVTATADHPFIGSTGRRVTAGVTRGDAFAYPVPASGFAATMCIDGECGLPTFDASVANDAGLYQNRYGAFIGGDNGLVDITNASADASGKVLLIKDSYGNAFATYLAERTSELIVVDERHYTGEQLNVLISTFRPDAVIVLHNPLSLLSHSFDPAVWTATGDVKAATFTPAPPAEAMSAKAVPGVFGKTAIVNEQGLTLTLGPDQPLDPTLAADARTLASAIAKTGAAQVWVYAPRKEEVFADLVPAGLANPVDAKRATVLKWLRTAHPVIDLTGELSDPTKRDGYYFLTDHHWTSAAAQVATNRIVEQLSQQGVTLGQDDRAWHVVTGPQRFLGSDAAALPKRAVLPAEPFTYLEPDGGFRARICDGDTCAASMIYSQALSDPATDTNRYKAFLNAGFAPMHLHNDSPDAHGTIVIVKDSYAHPVAMMLAERASDVYLIDERGWDGKPLGQFISSIDADAVVLMHNQVSLLSQAFNRSVWRDAGH